MTKPVYLTYSGRNCEAVLQVMEAVLYEGYGLVSECMLPAFDDVEARLTRLIGQVARDGAVVAVITDDARDCPYMARDLRLALDAGAKIVPVVVGEAALPRGYEAILRERNICHISDFPTKEEMAAVKAAISAYMEKSLP